MRDKFKKEYIETIGFFSSVASRNTTVKTWDEAREFFNQAVHGEWIYVILFSDIDWVYSWGTASGKGERLKKAGLLQRKLTGKYDRRGEYLMLKAIYGMPLITLFEIENAVEAEQKRRGQIYHGQRQGACFRGFTSDNRDSITREIYERFKSTDRYKNIEPTLAKLFDDFIAKFYLAKLKHPRNPMRSFHYGDCLEPNFLGQTLGRPDIEEAVAIALNVEF